MMGNEKYIFVVIFTVLSAGAVTQITHQYLGWGIIICCLILFKFLDNLDKKDNKMEAGQ